MEVFLEALTDAALKLAVVLIPIIFAVLTRYLVLYLNKQMINLDRQGKETELIILQEIANIAVLAAEQILLTNEDKFNYAAAHLVAMSNELGIPLDIDQAEVLIESSVRLVKNELPLEFDIISGHEETFDGVSD